MKQFLLVSLLLLIALTSNAQTPGTMNIGTIVSSHWPSPSPSIMRPRWGAEWRQIETARGTYSWSLMDGWIAAAQQHNTQILFTFLDVPSWSTSDTTAPPPDLNDVDEHCQAPLAGAVRPEGDCMFAEFVTALMQHVCGATSQPSAPLKGKCTIRIFESWNEFNDGQFWSSNYTELAKMANDAAAIVRKYCGDCTVLAGNTSAGGDGYNANYYHNPDVSGRFDLALGQLLDAWHAIPNASLPNAVSFHAYGARRNVIPYPMPETNVSQASSLCTAANVPNPNCRTAVFDETAAVRTVLQQRSWAANLPIWNTEGGFGRNDDMTDNVSQTDWNTNFLRQAYVARWMLALASSGTVTNLWYEYDDACWGTMMGYGTPASSTGCPNDPTIPSGFTPIHQTWVQMLSFLSGATFNGPCTHSGTIWSCVITKAGQQEEFIWTTQWLSTASVNIGSTYHQYADLAGAIHPISGSTVAVSNQPILLQLSSNSSVSISPTSATVSEGATQQFTASAAATWQTTCGTISSTGLFKAPLYPSTSCMVTATGSSGSATASLNVISPIVMTPPSAATPQGSAQQFSASMPVTWSAKCGSIRASGLFTASAPVGSSCTIEGLATGSVKYTVFGYDKILPANTSMTISPASTTVTEGATQQFTASATASWQTNCGAISSTGLFKAPLYPSTTCTVTATGASGSTTASLNVVSPIVVTPPSAATPQGKTQQFSASMPVTWSAKCGSVTASGLFTASAPPGSFCTIQGIATGAVKYSVYSYDKIVP